MCPPEVKAQLTLLSKVDERTKAIDATTKDTQKDVKALLADADDGPHTLLEQPDMRNMWKKKFKSNESVQWNTFWAAFPNKLEIDNNDVKVGPAWGASGGGRG